MLSHPSNYVLIIDLFLLLFNAALLTSFRLSQPIPVLFFLDVFFFSLNRCRGLVRYALRNDTCSLLIKVSPAVPWQRLQHPQLSARSWHLQNCWAMNLIVKLALIAWRNIWLPQALHSRNPVDIDLLTCWDHAWSSVVGVLACFRCIFVRPGRNLSYRLYNTVYIYYINYIYFIIIYIIYIIYII